MADEPYFPTSRGRQRATDAYREPAAPAPAALEKKMVVSRPEPPREDARAGAKPKLTNEEVRALLAVTEVNRSGTRWKSAAKRGGVMSVPTTVISIFLHLVAGAYAPALTFVVVIAALVWSARPLFGKGDWA